MRADELRALLDHRPFQPIRLHISSGEHVDVIHPKMALVSRFQVAVALSPNRRVADVIAHYNLIHVVKISRLQPRRRRRA
jgi:hypothetical protein